MNPILVNEVFETVQGEATFTGTPAVFLRLQGCPVGCGWCDTKHTWFTKPEQEATQAEIEAKTEDSDKFARYQADSIARMIADDFRARHVVITGGEPCLYDLRELTGLLLSKGYTVQIETSGTHEILVDPATFITVSPKVDMPGGFMVRADAMQMAHEVKHPVGKEKDLDKLHGVLEMIDEPPPSGVWLQPLSQSPKATKICIDLATKYGYRISVQTHKYIGVR